MKRLAVVGLVLVASCASGPDSFPLPDGRVGYSTSCNGSAISISSCYRDAAKICGGKYEIIGTDGSASSLATNGVLLPAAFSLRARLRQPPLRREPRFLAPASLI
jgi:hypothetical protein